MVSHEHLSGGGGGEGKERCRPNFWGRVAGGGRGKWPWSWRCGEQPVEEQSASAQVNIPTSTIVLHTPVPLSLTLTEEKGDTPSLTQTQACIKWFLSCASKRKLFVNYTKTMTQCMPLTCVKSN